MPMKTLQMFNSEYGLMLFPSSSFGEMELDHTSAVSGIHQIFG